MSKRMNQIKDALLFDQPHTPAARQIMPCRNARCASAGPNTPCSCTECRGALHNPPARKRTRSKARPGRAAKRTRSICKCGANTCRSCGPKKSTRLNVSALGTAVEIVYRDSRGQRWSHKFTGSAKVYRTHDGKQLIVAPVRVQEFVV